jgi:hypothetical protein
MPRLGKPNPHTFQRLIRGAPETQGLERNFSLW